MSVAAALAAVAVWGLAPSSSAAAAWPPATCRAQAAKVSYWGDFMVRHYAGMVYPADVAYLQLRRSLGRYEAHRCGDRLLGRTLRADYADANCTTIAEAR